MQKETPQLNVELVKDSIMNRGTYLGHYITDIETKKSCYETCDKWATEYYSSDYKIFEEFYTDNQTEITKDFIGLDFFQI